MHAYTIRGRRRARGQRVRVSRGSGDVCGLEWRDGVGNKGHGGVRVNRDEPGLGEV